MINSESSLTNARDIPKIMAMIIPKSACEVKEADEPPYKCTAWTEGTRRI